MVDQFSGAKQGKSFDRSKMKRRHFLSQLSGSMAMLALPVRAASSPAKGKCWLSVCVPLVIEDAAGGLHTEIILTSASFNGLEGYKDKEYATDYELYLYDFTGKTSSNDGRNKVMRITVPAMRPTIIKCGDLIGGGSFWGGMTIRLRAKGKDSMHVADLFSAAFVKWSFSDSFDMVHAHPDPLQFRTPDRFFSSMPFPGLDEYSCTLSVFNPYETSSAGRIVVYGRDGRGQIEQPYKLGPHGSALFNLNAGTLSTDLKHLFNRTTPRRELLKGGSIVIENEETRVKNFAYMLIKGNANNAFAAEHTIHQGNYPVRRGSAPFGNDQSFKARGWVYSSFIFKNQTVGELNMSSRVHLSAGRPLEDEMWLLAYTTDAEGNIQWSTRSDESLATLLPASFLAQGAIRLKPFQSCGLDFETLSLKSGFAGGIGIGTSPQTSHVLIKIEVRVHNWNTSSFSHFRPGSRAARALQDIPGRAGLASDYVVSGARLKRTAISREADCLIGTLNIEENKSGEPTLEVFDSDGYVTSKKLGTIPGLACRHFLLSDLLPDLSLKGAGPLTLRLTDANAVVIMSALHIDYKRRDVAIDHGSDRFSTYIEYGC